MQTIASNTGGKAFINTNDMAAGAEQLFRENASYYMLGYESVAEKGPGHWRRLDVKVNRPDLDVRARTRHYTEKPAKPATDAPPASGATEALSGLLPNVDMPLTVTLAPFAIPGKSDLAAVATVLALDRRRGAPMRSGTVRDLELEVRAFDPEGRPRGTQDYRVRTTLDVISSEGALAELITRMDLKPGAYELRLALHDTQSDGRGSVYADLEIPDFARAPVSLSGVLLASNGSPISAPKDALAALVPIQPTANRVFNPREQVTVFARLYQGGRSRPVPIALDDPHRRRRRARGVLQDGDLRAGTIRPRRARPTCSLICRSRNCSPAIIC